MLVFLFCIITFLFGLIFKFIPDTAIPFRDVWMGAAVTSILFTVGKVIIGFYLGHSALISAYVASASLVIFSIWILLLSANSAVRSRTDARLRSYIWFTKAGEYSARFGVSMKR